MIGTLGQALGLRLDNKLNLFSSSLFFCRKGNKAIINILSEHGGNLSPGVSTKLSVDTSGDPMLSQPPPWSLALNGVTSLPNRQTSDHQRLETQSTKGNNLCDVTDPIDIEKVSLILM